MDDMNVIFDKASLWLPSNKEILSDSNVLKDVLDSSHVQLSLDEAEAEAKKDTAEKGLAQNSWQIGIKKLGQLKHFLGFEVDCDEDEIFLHQKRYSKDLLMKFRMLNCKPISTPLEPNARICAHKGKDLAYVTIYRQLVGHHDTQGSKTSYVFNLKDGVISW
uniref:Reverse transcriptase Ty1/copia-type domain-containing protein n=1 Tax=Solanum lycopersicum TaxID=4081 RepID=A0A3Q7HMB3_SOLLC